MKIQNISCTEEEILSIIMFSPTWEHEMAVNILNIVKKNEQKSQPRPIMVGVVGMPGSGKTTSSDILASTLQTKYKISCVVIPMDGYHFSISKLKAMKDPEDVIYRRGAPDTFDAELLRNDLTTIKNGTDNEKSIPGFDHQIGDPSPDQHLFKRNLHRVVIVEGLYLLHEDEKFGWHGIKVGFSSLSNNTIKKKYLVFGDIMTSLLNFL